MLKTFKIIFASIFVLVGLSLMFFSLYTITLAIKSEQWTNIEGVIVESGYKISGPSKPSNVNIEYEYYLSGGDVYIGDNISYGGIGLSKNKKRLQIQKYEVGKHILVYYDINDFGRSVLEPGFDPQIFSSIFVSLVFIIFGIVVLVRIRNGND